MAAEGILVSCKILLIEVNEKVLLCLGQRLYFVWATVVSLTPYQVWVSALSPSRSSPFNKKELERPESGQVTLFLCKLVSSGLRCVSMGARKAGDGGPSPVVMKSLLLTRVLTQMSKLTTARSVVLGCALPATWPPRHRVEPALIAAATWDLRELCCRLAAIDARA